MESPPSTPTAGWWKVWLAAVIGGPLLACGCAFIPDKYAIGGLAFFGLCGVSLVMHFVASLSLAGLIAARREEQSHTGSTIGLTIGLLVGGWALIIAILFAGCLGIVVLH